MYVIRVTATRTGSGAGTVVGRSVSNGDTAVFHLPADKCTWVIGGGSTGYTASAVRFYAGDSSGGEDVSGSTGFTINSSFGYIGKSGRFVEMAA